MAVGCPHQKMITWEIIWMTSRDDSSPLPAGVVRILQYQATFQRHPVGSPSDFPR